MEGFAFASQLNLNMGYYAIRLDYDAQKICTIIPPCGKYSYLSLLMGLCNPYLDPVYLRFDIRSNIPLAHDSTISHEQS